MAKAKSGNRILATISVNELCHQVKTAALATEKGMRVGNEWSINRWPQAPPIRCVNSGRISARPPPSKHILSLINVHRRLCHTDHRKASSDDSSDHFIFYALS